MHTVSHREYATGTRRTSDLREWMHAHAFAIKTTWKMSVRHYHLGVCGVAHPNGLTHKDAVLVVLRPYCHNSRQHSRESDRQTLRNADMLCTSTEHIGIYTCMQGNVGTFQVPLTASHLLAADRRPGDQA